MHDAKINDVTLRVDTFGDAADPALLLIMGAAGSMDRWEEPFCEQLAAAGRHVIRYDHRDTGGSTTWPPGEPGYGGDDLLADAVGVLDHLGVDRAHVVGLSMGGGLAQELAVRHPGRVRTLTLMSTTLAGSGGPELPPMSDELAIVFSGEDAPEPPDWGDREAAIAYLLEAERPYAGARGIDEPAMRELLGRMLDRSPSPASGDNHFAIEQGEGITHDQITEIAAPTLVVHGTHDPLFPPAHGEALAAAIPGARLLLVEGLGHELPRWAWDDVLPALIEHTAGGRPAAE
jgi:pimeloyl-ACP methyl ester carboxylesterase